MCTNNKEIKYWLQQILAKKNIEKLEFQINGNTEKGSGYVGEILFITVQGQQKNGSTKTYNFALKHAKEGEIRAQLPVRHSFLNEIIMYDKVLPKMLKFQTEKKVGCYFDCFPKCYGTISENSPEVVVLENLRSSGFQLHDRTVPMSLQHIRLVLGQYAKYHAISFAIKDQQKEEFCQMADGLTEVLKDFYSVGTVLETTENAFISVANFLKNKGIHKISEKMHSFSAEKIRSIFTSLADAQDPCAIIIHGDCWINNFMFKYKDEQKSEPTEVRILDWQFSRVASPIFDLSYFIFAACSEEELNHFEELNRYYHTTLSNFLRELGSDPDVLFPYSTFMNQWKKYGKFGVVNSPLILKMELADKEDTPDWAERIEKGDDFGDILNIGVKNEDEYFRRACAVMVCATKWNLI